MPRKRELSAKDFLAIMKRVMEAPEMPIPEYLFDLDIMEIDMSAFPPPLSSVLGKKPFSPDTMLPASGSRAICIRVPARVIRSYKVQAAAKGCCYQSLMNRALAEAAKGHL